MKRPSLPPRVYIRRDYELKQFGYTAGCPWCAAVQSGTTGPRHHSEECRLRIEAVMRADPALEGRLSRVIITRAAADFERLQVLGAGRVFVFADGGECCWVEVPSFWQ